jgi:hypothetical protein
MTQTKAKLKTKTLDQTLDISHPSNNLQQPNILSTQIHSYAGTATLSIVVDGLSKS